MMPRYSLRTLLIVLAIGPSLVAGVWWGYQREVERRRKAGFDRLIELIEKTAVVPESWKCGPGPIDDFSGGCRIVPASEQDIETEE
jgi:hypothetical protein